MASESYFQNFPTVEYGNTTAVDITRRVVVQDIVYNSPYVYYAYDLADYERPDQLSHRYYSDAYKSWIIYLSNKVTDPYYEWYLQEKELYNLLTTKYGSYELSKIKVKYYRNNWVGSENITTAYYDSLPADLKIYWEPVYINNSLNSYARKKEDLTVNTNKIYSYQVDDPNGFIQDELCHVVFNNSAKGNGQILAIDFNTNTIMLQHTIGTMDQTVEPSSYLYGVESGSNTGLINAFQVASNLNQAEESYWEPVTYFVYETEKNEFNKSVLLLDSSYAKQTTENLRILLSNN